MDRYVALVLALLAGCAAGRMHLEPLATRHRPARTDLRVAVLPFGDARPTHEEPLGGWLLVPLVPYSSSSQDREDERSDAPDADRFYRQVPRLLAAELQRSGLFARVDYRDDGQVDPAAYDLVISGELRACRREEVRTLYGITVGALPLWALGAPLGTDRVSWDLVVELRLAGGGPALRSIRLTDSRKRWTGLYWGAAGYPDDEAALLHDLFARGIAELDRSLDQVPALAALSARRVAPTEARLERRRTTLAGRTVLVLFEGKQDETVTAFAELVAQQLARQTRARVLGIKDLDALLSWEKSRELVGCVDEACYSGAAGAVGDWMVTLSRGTLASQQTLTVKLVDVKRAVVLGHTTWQGTGSDPSVFVDRLPDIVHAALEPLAPAD
jgi:hypothetical protein